MYYRTTYEKPEMNKLSLLNYLKNTDKYKKYKNVKVTSKDNLIDKLESKLIIYSFDDEVMEYYDNRNEFKYVGIIDKEVSRRKNKKIEEIEDVFKLREKRPKIVAKKRETGLQNIFGSVCGTSKNKEYLENIAKDINLKLTGKESRSEICGLLKSKLLELEKYSTGKNKITYIMVPKNHPNYQFPYNLEDRRDYIMKKLNDNIKVKYDIQTEQKNKEIILTIKNNDKLKEYEEIIQNYNFKKEKNNWILVLN
jgi:hypothetical protein